MSDETTDQDNIGRPAGQIRDLGGPACPVCGFNTPDPRTTPACYVAYAGRREGCPGLPSMPGRARDGRRDPSEPLSDAEVAEIRAWCDAHLKTPTPEQVERAMQHARERGVLTDDGFIWEADGA